MTTTDVEPMLLTYKSRLNPTRAQHRALEMILEQQRQLANAALAERIDCYAKTGKSINEYDQSKSLTLIRQADPAHSNVQRRIQRGTLKRVDLAYKAFYRRAKAGAGARAGFPKFKGREWFDSFAFDAFQQIKLDGKRLRFAGMPGGLRVHLDRPLPTVGEDKQTSIKGVWFKRAGRRWYVGFQCEVEPRATRDGLGSGAIGVDWGTSVLAALSSGELVANPRPGEALAKQHARIQRSVSRKKKGSKGRLQARRHLQAINRRIANRRRNTLDKLSARLVRDFGVIAMEKLNVAGMVDGARAAKDVPAAVTTRRNREALDAAPYMLRQMVSYKARREGATLIAVDAKNTTQLCHWCGGMHPKELSEMTHTCTTPGPTFGRVVHRKVNAARVILARAINSDPEKSGPDNRGGPVPGGAVMPANLNNGSGRLENTGGAQALSGRRSNMEPPTVRDVDRLDRRRGHV